MSLFSFLRKNKQESPSDDGAFYSRAEEESKAVRSRAKRRQGGQRDPAADPVLPEKKRARRRLIGAVALVLAAVIGLPMILDAEPQPLADDIAIRIPSKDKAPALDSPRAAALDPASSLDPQEEVVELAAAEPAAAPARPQALTSNEAVPSRARDAEPSGATAAKSEPRLAPVTVDAHAKSAQAKAAEKAEDDHRAKALLDGKPDPKTADGKAGKFVIQVAALASKEKVDELQTKLKQAGIQSFTQTVATGSGERTRIRVGPFVNKEDAEKVRARIVKLGLNGSVVPA